MALARALAFDYEAAMARATDTFWRGGYDATSLRDLLKAMGIGEGSFYNSLGSKKNAYLECLKLYDATVNRRRGAAFMAAPTAALGLRAFFADILDSLDDPAAPRVCLLAGSITPAVLEEAALQDYMQAQVVSWISHLATRFAADQQAGLLPAAFDADATAAIIVTYVQGLWRLALIDYDRTRFERQIEVLLTGLGL